MYEITIHWDKIKHLKIALQNTARVHYKFGRTRLRIQSTDINGLRAGFNSAVRIMYMLDEVEKWLQKRN